MGWLFGRKKKVPKVPFPEGQLVDEGTLRFPEAAPEKVIEPDNLKEAAGLTRSLPPEPQETPSMEEDDEMAEEELQEPEIVTEPSSPPSPYQPKLSLISGEPLYVKMDVYQRILGEVEVLKEKLTGLSSTSRELENSEYNEEVNFDKLRKSMKSLHDRMLQVDKMLFKL